MRILTVFLLSLALLPLGACSSRDYDPFSPTPAGLDVAGYSEFPDIPVPRRMTPVKARTFVSVGNDGQKIGVETFSGEADMDVLARVMDDNMRRDGWALQGNGNAVRRYVQLYHRGQRFAILHLGPQMGSTEMEIWVMETMPAGSKMPPLPVPPPAEKTSSSFSDAVMSIFAPATSAGGQQQQAGQDPPSDISTAPLSTAPAPSGAAAVESRELP